jgi:hypothetical protein
MLFLNSSIYSQGNSIFKDNQELDLDKFIKLDISKYKITDVKKLFGEKYLTNKEMVNGKEEVTYYINLKNNEKKYTLYLSNKNDSASLFLDLIEDGAVPNKAYFKSCTEIKNKYEKQFGNSFRYTKRTEKNGSNEDLSFQINSSNHTIELGCMSYQDTIVLLLISNQNKKNTRFMSEVSKISCEFDRQRVEHLWSKASNNNYLAVRNMDKKNAQNLYIDDHRKKIGRVLDYNWAIDGEYKTYSKDKIEVVEKINDDSKRTWLLNRMNGEIEVFMEGRELEANTVKDGVYKVRNYGTCQKFKSNVF